MYRTIALHITKYHKLKTPLIPKQATLSKDDIITKPNQQTFKWATTLSLSIKTPVDSTMNSTPVSAYGISSWFLQIQNKNIKHSDLSPWKTPIPKQHKWVYYKTKLLHVAKNSDELLAEEKGLRVLNRNIMVLPLAMDRVVFEHVSLHKIVANIS